MSETREKILRCAGDLYMEQGMEGLSIRKIARQVGITPMAIYRHFDSKEDLQEQLLIEGFRTFGSFLYGALRGKDPLQRLRLTADGYVRFALEQTRYYEIIFMAVDSSVHLKLEDAIRQEALATFNFLVDRVRECMDAGVLEDDHASALAVSLLAEVNGLVALYLTNNFGWTRDQFERIYRQSMDRILRGFYAPDHPPGTPWGSKA